MRAGAGVLSILVAALGCGGAKAPLTSGTGSPGGSSTSSTTSTASTSGGTNGGTGSSSGGGGTTGASSSSGTTTGPGGPCGWGLTWYGDVCAAPDCASAPVSATCALGDGGYGNCVGSSCQNIDYASDSQNCGQTGLICPDQFQCLNGYCQLHGSYVSCNSAVCPAGTKCYPVPEGCLPVACDTSSVCLLDGGTWPVADIGACCGTTCIDYNNDPANCGNCGLVCPPATVCQLGQCVPGKDCASGNGGACALTSGAKGSCCLGACVDLQSDDGNCGMCGITCAMGTSCVAAACVGTSTGCPPGTKSPPLTGKRACYPTTCPTGGVGSACYGDDGQYVWEHLCCAEGCVNLQSDPANCGTCGHVCESGTCAFGLCGSDCATAAPGYGRCVIDGGNNYECCSGSCVDYLNDDLNCDGCSFVCPGGSHCMQGSCVSDVGDRIACDAGHCSTGTTCVVNAEGARCFPAQCGDAFGPCALSKGATFVTGLCCGGACVDLNFDPSNCGTCGALCPYQGFCVYGHCEGGSSCPPGTLCAYDMSACILCLPTSCVGSPQGLSCAYGESNVAGCCGEACSSLEGDPQNCGGCGVVCPSGICNHSTCLAPTPSDDCLSGCLSFSACTAGKCVGSECSSLTGLNCLAQDGTIGTCCSVACTHLLDDPQNCGACGIACPAGQTCAGGTCSGSPECGPGNIGRYCNLDTGLSYLCCPGYGCVDTTSDANNCGACGKGCPGGSCVAGTCS